MLWTFVEVVLGSGMGTRTDSYSEEDHCPVAYFGTRHAIRVMRLTTQIGLLLLFFYVDTQTRQVELLHIEQRPPGRSFPKVV